jgi:hypothetical protein
MAWRELSRGRVGSTVIHATVDVVCAGLGNTSSSHILVTLVDSILHLLEELINVDQVVLGANVGHGREMVSRSLATRAVTTASSDSNRGRDVLILWHRAIEYRELKSLQSK